MAKAKTAAPELTAASFVSSFLDDLAKAQTAGSTILAGDLGQHTWGIPIPPIPFQYVIGGSTVLPCQRYIAASGAEKSFKSTLMKEIGTWHQMAGGIYMDIDNEGKTSDTMFDAMTNWRVEEAARGSHMLNQTNSIEEWQNCISLMVEKLKSLPIPAKGRRLPIFIALDSLTGKGLAQAQEKLVDEGHTQARSFDAAAGANAVTQFIQNLRLRGTTVTIGMVRHLVETMGDGGMGPQQKESGAKRVNFQHSINLRMRSIENDTKATHPGQFVDGPAVQRHTIRITPQASCIGPVIDRRIDVDVLWQYIPQPDGSRRQSMKYDWDGCLGRWLYQHQNGGVKGIEKACEWERKRLTETLKFSAPKVNEFNCEELGLEGVSSTEFGRAIHANPEVSKRIQNHFGIKEYPSLQDAEIEEDVIPESK